MLLYDLLYLFYHNLLSLYEHLNWNLSIFVWADVIVLPCSLYLLDADQGYLVNFNYLLFDDHLHRDFNKISYRRLYILMIIHWFPYLLFRIKWLFLSLDTFFLLAKGEIKLRDSDVDLMIFCHIFDVFWYVNLNEIFINTFLIELLFKLSFIMILLHNLEGKL